MAQAAANVVALFRPRPDPAQAYLAARAERRTWFKRHMAQPVAHRVRERPTARIHHLSGSPHTASPFRPVPHVLIADEVDDG